MNESRLRAVISAPSHIRWGYIFEAVGVIVLFVLAIFLRFDGITAYSLNPDEGIYYRIAHDDLHSAVSSILGNAHPPLFYIMLRLMAPLGNEIVWLRLPSFIFGCLSVVGIYLLGKRIAGPSAGLISALPLAFSWPAVVLSQVIRPYAMQMAFITYCLFFAVSWVRDPRQSFLVGYSMALVLAVSTHYSSIILAGAAAAVLVCRAFEEWPRRVLLRQVILAHTPVALALILLFVFHLLPHVIGSGVHVEAREGWLKPFFVTSAGEAWKGFLGVACYLVGSQYGSTLALLFALGMLAAIFERKYAVPALSLLALSGAVTFSVAGQLPFGGSRHSFYLLPFLTMPIACLVGFLLSLPLPGMIAATTATCVVLALPGQVSERFNSTQATVLIPLEQITTVTDYGRMSSILKEITGSESVTLCDPETYEYLAMEFHGWTPTSYASGVIPIKVFNRGRSFVIVVGATWILGADADGGTMKFASTYRDIASTAPDLHLMTRDSVWIAQGGWGHPLTSALDRLDEQRSQETKFILKSHSVPGFDLREIAPANYLRTVSP